jgi:hypothetical protein
MSITRFTIKVAGQTRSLFSVIERGDEITIGLKSPFGLSHAGPAGHPSETPNISPAEIREHRFSIHPSHESLERVNVIKMTRILANGRKDFLRHYTRAIKNEDKFALIYARRCGRLDAPEFIPKGKFKNLSLGTFDHSAFTLIYGIAVGPKTLKFELLDQFNGITILEHELKNMNLIVLWTFLNIPSQPFFFSVAPQTVPGDDFLMNGETAEFCTMQFVKHSVNFTEQMFGLIKLPEQIKQNILFSRIGLTEFQLVLASAKPIFSAPLFEIGEKERRLSLSPFDLR